MASALELVRGVRNLLDRVVRLEWHGEGWSMVEGLDAALAEMKRDQAFIEAAAAIGEDIGETLGKAPDGRWFFGTEEITEPYAKRLAAFCDAYRARREERGKHGEPERPRRSG